MENKNKKYKVTYLWSPDQSDTAGRAKKLNMVLESNSMSSVKARSYRFLAGMLASQGQKVFCCEYDPYKLRFHTGEGEQIRNVSFQSAVRARPDEKLTPVKHEWYQTGEEIIHRMKVESVHRKRMQLILNGEEPGWQINEKGVRHPEKAGRYSILFRTSNGTDFRTAYWNDNYWFISFEEAIRAEESGEQYERSMERIGTVIAGKYR